MDNVSIIPFHDLEQMAVAVSKGGLFGAKSREQILTLMMIAQAEGCHPVTAMSRYHIIENRPSKRPEAMLSDLLDHGGKVQWVNRSDESVTAKFSHPQGGEVTVTWDKTRATKAGLWGRNTWAKYPQQMLSARVISEGVGLIYPQARAGLYAPEEVIDFGPSTGDKIVDAEIVFDPAECIGEIDSAPDLKSLTAVWGKVYDIVSKTTSLDTTIVAYEAAKARFIQADKIREASEKHVPNMKPDMPIPPDMKIGTDSPVVKPPLDGGTPPLSDLAKPVEFPPYVAPPPAEPKADKRTKHEKDAAKIKAVLDNITDEVTRKEISTLVYHYATKQQPKTKTIDYGRYVAAIEDLWRDAQGSDDDKILPVFITAMKDRFK